jgi:hypothetical protein
VTDDSGKSGPPRRSFLNLAITGTAAALTVAAGYPATLLAPSSAQRRSVDVGRSRLSGRLSRSVELGDRAALVIRLPMAASAHSAFARTSSDGLLPERNRSRSVPCRRLPVEGDNIAVCLVISRAGHGPRYRRGARRDDTGGSPLKAQTIAPAGVDARSTVAAPRASRQLAFTSAASSFCCYADGERRAALLHYQPAAGDAHQSSSS